MLPKIRFTRALFFIFTLFSIFSFHAVASFAGTCEGQTYSAYPPFYAASNLPNVIFMMDNSGSMKNPMYRGSYSYNSNSTCGGYYDSGFSPSTSYYGMFDATKNYAYDRDVAVDACAFGPANDTASRTCSSDTPYNVKINENSTGAFVEASCTPDGNGGNCWSGNFLNWAVTRRIDAARQVMVGGKVENRAGYTYRIGQGTEYKIVGNNEPSDRYLCKKDTQSNISGEYYTPFAQNTSYIISSTANGGGSQSSYDPYGKIIPSALSSSNSFIYALQAGTTDQYEIIGEYGIIPDAMTESDYTVYFKNSYTNPVVITSPLRSDGGDESIISIKNIQSGQFTAWVHERPSGGAHTSEAAFFMVVERGTYTLPGGLQLQALISTEKSISGSTSLASQSTSFSSGFFTETPVVVAVNEMTSSERTDTIIPRIYSIGTTGVTIVHEREATGGSNNYQENIKTHLIAVEPGTSEGPNEEYMVIGRDGGAGAGKYTDSFDTLNFGGITAAAFVANMQTYNGSDEAALRYQNFSGTDVEIEVEEIDSGGHTEEEIGYIAFGSMGGYNLAVLVDEEPTGLLQDIAGTVRVGSSVYRYRFDSDIYNGEDAHGGTMITAIPYNPFVKNPGTGDYNNYRLVESHARGTTDDAIDILEHYPLVWGTTPLAENLYEVGRYFMQVAPYYVDKPSISYTFADNSTENRTYKQDTSWDPFVYSGVKENCVTNYILLFTDGEPYRDAYVPDTVVMTDEDGDPFGVNIMGGDTYDGSDHYSDCFKTGYNDNCSDDLDDVAAFLYGEDLRSDLAEKQNIKIYTVAFGSATAPAILRKTANNTDPDLVTENADGTILTFPSDSATQDESLGETPQYFAAEDGLKLKDILTKVFDAIANEAITGTQASSLGEQAASGSVLSQALFFDTREFADVSTSPATKYNVKWSGTIKNYWQYTQGGDTNIREDDTDQFYLNYNFGSSSSQAEDTAVTVDGSTIEDIKTVWDAGALLRLREVAANPTIDATTPNTLSTERRVIYTPVEISTTDGEGNTTSTTTMKELVTGNVEYIAPHFGPGNYDTCLTEQTSCTQTDAGGVCTEDELDECQALDPTCTQDDCDDLKVDACEDRKVAENVISYTRGVKDDFSSDGSNSCRSRQVLTTAAAGSTSKSLWKLGDIIYSTPKLLKYSKNTLIFAGANDGMLHVFNTGHISYDKLTDNTPPTPENNRVFHLQNDDTSSTALYADKVGKEVWSFIPQNALPYLKYWADPDFKHVYGVDGAPYFYYQDGHYILIMGMRFGGASGTSNGSSDPTALNYVPHPEESGKGLSAYFALDVTDPYNPVFLWEFTHENLGFSYSGPSIITQPGANASITSDDKRYVMFLSGPTNYEGDSEQPARIFILPMYTDDKGTTDTADDQPFMYDADNLVIYNTQVADSFGGRLYTNGADADGDNYPDIIAYGLNVVTGRNSSTNTRTVTGQIRAIAPINAAPLNASSTFQWGEKALFSTSSEPVNPITNRIVFNADCFGKLFLYFGTGRFFYKEDQPGISAVSNSSNTLYGVNLQSCTSNLTDGNDSTACLDNFPLTNTNIFSSSSQTCEPANGTNYLSWKITGMEARNNLIWEGIRGDYFEERVMADPTETPYNIIIFTTTQPIISGCGINARSRLWALNCMTGDSMYQECDTDIYKVNANNIKLLLPLSRGDLRRLDSDDFGDNGNGSTTPWMIGFPPEEGALQQDDSTLNGEVFLWEER